MLVRVEGDKPSKYGIATISRNVKLNKYQIFYQREFLLQPGKIYRIFGKIPTDTFSEDYRNFCLQLRSYGAVTVDQVSLIPY